MSIDETIKTALQPLIPKPDPAKSTVVPQIYTGTATEYITFNYSEYPLEFADNAPQTIGYSVQVHYFCPLKKNVQTIKDNIQNALFTAGFSYPQIQDVTDGDGQHYVFLTTYEELRT